MGALVNFGPPDFPAYARLRFIPDPTKPGQEEADASVADDHLTRRLAVIEAAGGSAIDYRFFHTYGLAPCWITPGSISPL
jgi:hypothetical protein